MLQYEVQQLPDGLLRDLAIRTGSYRAWLMQTVQPVYLIGGSQSVSVNIPPNEQLAALRASRAFAHQVSSAAVAANNSTAQLLLPLQAAGNAARFVYLNRIRILSENILRTVIVSLEGVLALNTLSGPGVNKNVSNEFGTPASIAECRSRNNVAAIAGVPILNVQQQPGNVDDVVEFDPPIRLVHTTAAGSSGTSVLVTNALVNNQLRVGFEWTELDF